MGMWLVHFHHGSTVARVLSGRGKIILSWPSAVTKRLETTVLDYPWAKALFCCFTNSAQTAAATVFSITDHGLFLWRVSCKANFCAVRILCFCGWCTVANWTSESFLTKNPDGIIFHKKITLSCWEHAGHCFTLKTKGREGKDVLKVKFMRCSFWCIKADDARTAKYIFREFLLTSRTS